MKLILHVQVGSSGGHLWEELCEDFLLARLGGFALGVLLLKDTAVAFRQLTTFLKRESLLCYKCCGGASQDACEEKQALGACPSIVVHTLFFGSLRFFSLDLAGDAPESLADILLRVHDDFGWLEGCFSDLFGRVHQLALDEGHERAHLSEVYADTLLKARAHDMSKGT